MLLHLSVSKIHSRALLATSAHGTFSLFEDGRHVACIDSLVDELRHDEGNDALHYHFQRYIQRRLD